MVVFSSYPLDPRVRREAEALVEAGMSVDVICKRNKGQLRNEKINNVNIYRIKVERKRRGKLRYLLEYINFIFIAFIKLSSLFLFKRYHVIHIHNMPDILIISALIPKLAGEKLVLDIHDPMPELYMTKYLKSKAHPIVKLLKYLEMFSIKLANIVLTPNTSFRNLFISRGTLPHKIHIVMNSPQESIFLKKRNKNFSNNSQKRNKFVVIYNGFITERNGLDIAIEAINIARKEIPDLYLDVYGDGDFLREIQEKVKELNLKKIVKLHGTVSLEKVADAISFSDLGIIPNRLNVFTDLNFPTRIFEFLIMKKPVIVPKTQGILDYFDNDSLFFFEPGNMNDLSRAVIEVYSNPARTQRIVERGVTIYHKHRWELQKKHLVSLYRSIDRRD